MGLAGRHELLLDPEVDLQPAAAEPAAAARRQHGWLVELRETEDVAPELTAPVLRARRDGELDVVQASEGLVGHPRSLPLVANSYLSWRSKGSVLSIASNGSVLSVGSVGSVLSVGSVGSALSVLSIGSFGSVAAVLSFASVASVLSDRRRGAVLASAAGQD